MLTSLGMTQHVKVGQFIKAHYGGENAFLSEKFYPKENYIRVSNYDRCFLSAVSQFSGIYPETNESSRSLVSYPMYSELRNDEYLLRGFDVWFESSFSSQFLLPSLYISSTATFLWTTINNSNKLQNIKSFLIRYKQQWNG